jgi:hypothetical protein
MQSVSKQRNCNHVYNNRYFPLCLCRVLIGEVNLFTRVEVGSNTSTVTLLVVGGDEKGNLKYETVKYGRESQGTRTRERLRWQRPAAYTKDRPVLSSEGSPHKKNAVTVKH